MSFFGNETQGSSTELVHQPSVYPLFNGADSRQMGNGVGRNFGFHLHNWFASIETLRYKYHTYGHRHRNVYARPLGDLNKDLEILVKCVMDTRPDYKDDRKRLHMKEFIDTQITKKGDLHGAKALMEKGGDAFDILKTVFLYEKKPLPVAFQSREFVLRRRQELYQQIVSDELKYGNQTMTVYLEQNNTSGSK